MEKFDIFQIQFFKRLFHLPNITPRWLVRLETNITPLEFNIIRTSLMFWLKIMNKPYNCLIRQAYEALAKMLQMGTLNTTGTVN